MSDEDEDDTCIHDEGYTVHVEYPDKRDPPTLVKEWRTRVCDDCNATLLRETLTYKADGSGVRVNRVITDDTYWMLYTRAGRQKLVAEALEARGLPMPKFWDTLDT